MKIIGTILLTLGVLFLLAINFGTNVSHAGALSLIVVACTMGIMGTILYGFGTVSEQLERRV